MSARPYAGSCRCHATKLTSFSHCAPGDFQPRSDARTCKFCARHRGIWISDPKGWLRIESRNPTMVRRFGSGEVAFHFCATCDDLTHAICADVTGQRRLAVVRRDSFEEIAAAAKPVVSTNFEGASLSAARKRRSESWTPCETLSVP